MATIQEIRDRAEADLKYFINLVDERRTLGQCHSDLIHWWNREDAKSHQLVLLPRDHMKSTLLAYRVAWAITKDPAVRVLYVSSSSRLAKQQLRLIKQILTSPVYQRYWPDMVHPDEMKREKWTETEICVDHPLRKLKMVRDPTVFIAGLTTNIVGMHCDIAAYDDVVIDDNAYNEEQREKTRSQVGYLASIAGTDSQVWVVGTRYHPKDLYNDFMEQIVEVIGEDGDIQSSSHLYEIYEKRVEENGQFLWPRQKNRYGETYGFDAKQLAIKKAQYSDLTKFRAQYYNDPNDLSTATITPEMFQYYNPKLLRQEGYSWYYKDQKLNVFAAVDFAYSLAKRADFTAIAVLGIDSKSNYYILEIDRFKTKSISEYYERIFKLYQKWQFRKLRAEVSVAQAVIVNDLKENYIRANGLALTIDEFRPNRHGGSKEERIEAILQPRYANRQIYHYAGGHCSLLEEELVMQRPPHDDIKDALASCVEVCMAPTLMGMGRSKIDNSNLYNSRFGGIG